jgi:hypothetical protein
VESRIGFVVLAAVHAIAITGTSSAFGASAAPIELKCQHRSGEGASFEREVDRVSIYPDAQKIRFWVSTKNDGWVYENKQSDLFGKEVTALSVFPDGVIDGTAHNFFVSAAFRYSQEDGRLQWLWIGGGGGVFELEFNCWRIH